MGMGDSLRYLSSGARRLTRALLLVASLFAPGAFAAPPAISAGPITVTIPPVGATTVVNLRQLGVLSGSAPLTLANVTMLVNGQRSAVLIASLLPSRGPGNVCVTIRNADFSSTSTQPLSLSVAVRNATGAAGPTTVGVINGAGPTADIATCGDPNTPPVANAGVDQIVRDTDGVAGETVELDGSRSTDRDAGTVLTYRWTMPGVVLGTGPRLSTRLPDGTHTVQLTVIDDSGDQATNTSTDTVQVTVGGSQAPVVSAGNDRTVADTNSAAGESVALSATANDPDGTIQSYTWRLNGVVLGTGPTIQAALPDGVSDITVTVVDNSGLTATDTVRITVNAPQQPPVVNAGADRTIADTNNAPGESVTLTATASDPDGTVQSYTWRLNDVVLGTGATIQAALPDGASDVSVTVIDNSNLTATDTVRITVTAAPQAPTVNAGADRTIPDSNNAPGETVALTATASDADGTIQSYAWRLGNTTLGTGATLQAALTDGVNDITVVVTDNSGLTATDSVRITVTAPTRTPTVNAGADRVIADTNGTPGETVTLTATASDPDGTIASYRWVRGETVLGTTATIQAALPDGVSDIMVTVTDNTGLTATDDVRITVAAVAAPIVNAGADQVIADTDGAAGELVTLSGSATDADGTIASYQWSLGANTLGAGATLQTRLADGVHQLTLLVTDNTGATGTDTVQITVNGGVRPTANAGADIAVADTDGTPGELISLSGTGTDADGTIASFEWLQGDTSLGTGATLQARLPDGVSTVTLRVTDNVGSVGTDTLQVTVGAVVLPVANAGVDRTLSDTDREPGEVVSLAGSATTRTGTITSYRWLLGSEPLGTGNPLRVRLPDGVNVVTLVVSNSLAATGSDSVQITVSAAPVRVSLASLPDLTPQQKSVAESLDRICVELDRALVDGQGLTVEQRALNRRCDALYFNNTAANQTDALSTLVTDNFAVARTQTLLFANSQYASVMDRLIALRGGARGLSLAGLSITVDGGTVPLAELQELGKQLLGGGASADSRDATESGGLLNDKVGLWARGNYSFGNKDTESRSPAFDAKQWTLVGGMDYRVSDKAVVGGALAYGIADVDFTGHNGALSTRSWALSLYGSMYAGKNFYVDAIINAADSGYDANRNITYVDGSGLVNEDARGNTSGMTYSVGLSGGYDFLIGGVTVSPTLGVFYIDAALDGFAEKGDSGLNLLYDKQQFKSLTGNLGLRMTYSLNLSWAVLLPQLRVDYVREFNDDVDVFNVRFAADPDGASAPPIAVQTDNPDHSYWRLATGVSAQFRFGLSGYVEYQRLQSFEFISFQDLSFGIRAQRSF